MEMLTDRNRGYIEGYAAALQDMMYRLTGQNTCAKFYDPCTIDSTYIHSYAFDLKDGGRHHPLDSYDTIRQVLTYMLEEAGEYVHGFEANQ